MGKNAEKKKSSKLIIILFVLAIVLSLFLGMYIERHKKSDDLDMEKVSTTVSIDLLKEKIENIGELSTVEYLYTNASKFDENKRFESGWLEGVKIPFSDKSFIARWDGVIKAGIDITKVDYGIDNEKKIITIKLPEAEIFSHEVLNDTFETLDQTKNIFNQVEIDDINSLIGDSKDSMEKKAKERGILDTAENNARTLIQDSLRSIDVVKNEYEIVFDEENDGEKSTDESSEEITKDDE